MYYTYVLQSEVDSKFYIGHTQSLVDRLKRHNEGREKSTKNRRPFKCVFYSEFATKSEAYALERKLKSFKSHKIVAQFIQQKAERDHSSTG